MRPPGTKRLEIEALFEKGKTPKEIIAMGYHPEYVSQIKKRLEMQKPDYWKKGRAIG